MDTVGPVSWTEILGAVVWWAIILAAVRRFAGK